MRFIKRLLIFSTVVGVAFLLSSYFSTPGSPSAAVFSVAEGEGVESITDRLAEQGFVRNRFLFKWALSRSGLATRIQPGDHYLGGAASYADIVSRLASGGVAADEVTLLVREGESLRDIRAAIDKVNPETAKGFYSLTGEPAEYPTRGTLARTLSGNELFKSHPNDVSLEGYLFPDTYRVFREATAEDIIGKMLGNFERRLTPELRARILASGHSLHEVITMASIIEREVRTDEDRGIVSDIFWRRLDAGMPLQADSTVNYVTDGDAPAVSYEDTRLDSPYNMYMYRGLPPGPICNPGIKSIEAAASPQSNGWWYFLTDSQGGVHYGRTLDEHNRNKAAFLGR